MRHISTPVAVAAALIATAGAAVPAADAAVPKTGTWRGDHTQQLDLLGPAITYKTKMVITEFEGRIQSVVGSVRMECPAMIGVRDVRVLRGWRLGRGPKVSRRGVFTFWANGAYFHGTLSRSSAIGGTSATYGAGPDGPECRGIGRFNLQRRR
jgi:hypothetical protein